MDVTFFSTFSPKLLCGVAVLVNSCQDLCQRGLYFSARQSKGLYRPGLEYKLHVSDVHAGHSQLPSKLLGVILAWWLPSWRIPQGLNGRLPELKA